jgi:DNA-binding LacI/PurR family transcriptional regulator
MITMTDIASKAGVSRTVVSHVLNESHRDNVRIPDTTRRRILEVANEMGYRRNQLARSVALGKTHMIGYLVEEPGYEPYWGAVIGALDEAEELGFTLKVLSVRDDTLERRIQQCIELRLGGLLVRVNNDKSLIFKEASLAGIPVVTVDEGVDQPCGVRVAADDAPGCYGAIEHLTQLGHRKIGFISSDFPRINHEVGDVGSTREQLFRQEMAARGLELPEGYVTYDSTTVYGEYIGVMLEEESVQAATSALLDHPAGRPTAIFCWRDETAMLAANECYRRGLRIPEDISIVGFSDIGAARLFHPPLSTVASPWKNMGRTAIQQLVRCMSEEYDPSPVTHLVPSSFVARRSSGPVPR